MWVFATAIPQNVLVVAPRGPFDTPLGGYGWYPHRIGAWPTLGDLQPTAHRLAELLAPENFARADLSRCHLVGFSQGAALAYTYLMLYPHKVASLAALSGFLPLEAESLLQDPLLEDKPVFIAHGSLDDLVPVERARQAAKALQRAGAKVTYCEDQAGHKLSAACFRGLAAFLSTISES
jgi:phospholipase/carboxylesterase